MFLSDVLYFLVKYMFNIKLLVSTVGVESGQLTVLFYFKATLQNSNRPLIEFIAIIVFDKRANGLDEIVAIKNAIPGFKLANVLSIVMIWDAFVNEVYSNKT